MKNIHLAIIDPQADFADPRGSLYVPGAQEDMQRLGTMIERLIDKITDITVTLDSHRTVDIAHPLTHKNSKGEHPQPFTIISAEDYDKGVLLAKKFTVAAKRELMENDIQRISESHKPRFKPERLFLVINNCVDDLCTAKCGKIPKKESDCKGNCNIRIINDNASFHFEHGWIKLMKNDLKQLLAIRDSKKPD